MGKDQKPAGEDNDFFDDVDEDLVETEKEPDKETENAVDEDKFFAPEPDGTGENAELDAFFDEGEGNGDGEQPLLSDEFEETEEEKLRKKKVKKRAVIISACSVFVIAVCVFAFVFINQYNSRFIMKFDGKKVSVEEYKLYYYISQEEDVKNSALESLKRLIALENLAEDKNITLTEEEKAEAATNAQEWKESFASSGYDMPDISDERLAEIIGTETTLYDKLFELLTSGYTVDDSDFEEQYDDYVTNYKAYYIDAEYRYIMAETEENALKAKEMIESGTDITEVLAEYALEYAEGEEAPVLGIYEISYYFPPENVEHLLTLSEGQISDIMEFSGYYMVFITNHVTVPTDEENRVSFTDMYYDSKKYYMFEDEMTAFQNASNITVYEKVFDTFS